MMQEITYDGCVEACRKAYIDGTLLARARELGHSYNTMTDSLCMYESYDGFKCAIGVALSADTLRDIVSRNLNSSRVNTIDVIQYPQEDADRLYGLQEAHDGWLTGSDVWHNHFLKMIFPEGVPWPADNDRPNPLLTPIPYPPMCPCGRMTVGYLIHADDTLEYDEWCELCDAEEE